MRSERGGGRGERRERGSGGGGQDREPRHRDRGPQEISAADVHDERGPEAEEASLADHDEEGDEPSPMASMPSPTLSGETRAVATEPQQPQSRPAADQRSDEDRNRGGGDRGDRRGRSRHGADGVEAVIFLKTSMRGLTATAAGPVSVESFTGRGSVARDSKKKLRTKHLLKM